MTYKLIVKMHILPDFEMPLATKEEIDYMRGFLLDNGVYDEDITIKEIAADANDTDG